MQVLQIFKPVRKKLGEDICTYEIRSYKYCSSFQEAGEIFVLRKGK